jgi:hypothetical protein
MDETAGSPHWQSTIQCIDDTSERRRIVAQVRRKGPKNLGFFAVQNFSDRATIC